MLQKFFISACAFAFCLIPQFLQAASQYAGFYTGAVYTSISGNAVVPERQIGAVSFTVSEDGTVRSSSDLSGKVNSSGAITWDSNSNGFTSGTIAVGIISSSTSVNNSGTISTFRLSAKNPGPGIGEGNALAGRFRQMNPAKSLRDMNRIRFVDGRFLAVGTGGAFATSDDGVNWNRSGVPTVLDLYDVAYGNGHYVVVGDSSARFWSTNGVDWVSNPAGPGPVAGVAFGNGKFVSIHFSGGVSSSTDGVAWSSGPSFGGDGYSGIDFVNGEFAAWAGSTVAFSADASNWTVKTGAPGVGNITISLGIHTKIAYGNGVYVMAGSLGLAYSPDGKNWQKAARSPGVFFENSASVTFGNGKFIVCDTADRLWTSTNAQVWTEVDQIELHSLAYGNGRYVGVGNDLAISENGALWILPEDDDLRFDNREPGYIDPASDGNIVGTYAEGSSGLYSFGRNGFISWYKNQFENGSGLAPKLTSETLRFGASLHYAEPPVIAGNRGTVIVASDRQTVTFQLIPPVTSADLVYGARSDSALVFVGSAGAIIQTTNLFKTNWVVAASGISANLKHVAWYPTNKTGFKSQFLATGESGTLLASADGLHWTKVSTGLTTDLVGSAFDNAAKRFLVAAADGTLLQSTDGINWSATAPLPTPHTLRYFRNGDPNLDSFGIIGGGDKGLVLSELPGLPQILSQSAQFTMAGPSNARGASLHGAALGNGRYLAVGDRAAAVSLDGQLWARETNAYTFEAAAHGIGKFVAVGQDRTIASSSDGLNWQLQTSLPFSNRQFHAVTYGGGRFAAVGDNGLVMVSTDGLAWTDKSISTSVDYNDVFFNGGLFIAGGTSGTVLISTNAGESWIEKPTFMPEIKGVSFGNNLYVAVALQGWSAVSTNGFDWVKQQYPFISPVESRPDYAKLSFAGGLFYASTIRGEIYISADGLNWKRNFTGENEALLGGAAGNGVIMYVAGNEIFFLNVPDGGSPVITTQPQDTLVNEDGTLTLRAGANGAGVQGYWLKNGAALLPDSRYSGITSSTLSVSRIRPEDAGDYEFVAENQFGTHASRPARVSVNEKANIVSQPHSLVQAVGAKASLSVDAAGEGLTYQWFKHGQAIAGAVGPAFEIASVSSTDADEYAVEIKNAVGIRVSQPATLSVVSVAAGYAADPNWPAPATEFTASFIGNFAAQPDGKVILSGGFSAKLPDGTLVRNLARLNPDGTFDPTFTGDRPDNDIRAIYILPDGKILVGGLFQKLGTTSRIGLGRLNANGTVDTSYNAGITQGFTGVFAFAPGANGKIWVGGTFLQLGGMSTIKYLGLLNSDGTPDISYTPPVLKGYVDAIYASPDGSLLLGGGDISSRGLLTRIKPDKTIDNTFPANGGPGGNASITARVATIVSAGNGRFYIGGLFSSYGGVSRSGVVLINSDGTLDTSFNPPLPAQPATVSDIGFVGSDIILSGDFPTFSNGTNSQYLAMVDSTGAAAGPALPHLDGSMYKMQVLGDKSIIIAGNFQNVGGQPQKMFARLVQSGAGGLTLGIARPPMSLTVEAGQSATFAVAATGRGSLKFEWQKNGTPLPGKTDAALTIFPVTADDVGNYTAAISDATGGVITSVPASLSIGQSDDGVAFADWANGFAFPPGQNGLNDDADNDGYSNAAEFAYGTNPTVPDSRPLVEQNPVSVNNAVYPAVSYVRNKNAQGVAIQVRAAADVSFASAANIVAVGNEDLGNGLERVTVRSSVALPDVSTFFFDLSVTGQ
jgi:uncharacterized delta-60 repeat protein